MNHRRTFFLAAAAIAAGVAGPMSIPTAARACGGFFCNQQIPIDQSGEQIVFSIDENGVTAHILIQFQGNARDFAWVVPVMAKPTVKLGTQALFTTLLTQTQPRFTLDRSALQCARGRGNFGPSAPGSAAGGSTGADAGVSVLEMREVGPYATVILESKDAGELVAWLNANGYDQPASARPLIEHYVKQGMLFVALKLKQDAGTGEIQPLVLEMPHMEACVPLILTRVAAVPDMPVQAFVLGQGRAFPRNWFHVELNQARIDWQLGGRNYRALVTEAINEAAGHGFITEYAGKTTMFANALYTEGRFDLAALRNAPDAATLVNLLLQVQRFPLDQTMLALLRKYVPMPASLRDTGVPEQLFYQNILNYRGSLTGQTVDTAAFVRELEERVVAPLRDAQKMLDKQPYLTRLYSTVSPDEMTRDPLFHFNPHLPEVSNVHTAKALAGKCEPDGSISDLVVELENGERAFYPTSTMVNPFAPRPAPSAASQPAARRVQLVGPSGMPTNYTLAQAKLIDQALDRETPESVRANPPPGVNTGSSGLFGCALGPPAEASLAALLAVVGAALLLSTRRRR